MAGRRGHAQLLQQVIEVGFGCRQARHETLQVASGPVRRTSAEHCALLEPQELSPLQRALCLVVASKSVTPGVPDRAGHAQSKLVALVEPDVEALDSQWPGQMGSFAGEPDTALPKSIDEGPPELSDTAPRAVHDLAFEPRQTCPDQLLQQRKIGRPVESSSHLKCETRHAI